LACYFSGSIKRLEWRKVKGYKASVRAYKSIVSELKTA
jgi:hypothetical protein